MFFRIHVFQGPGFSGSGSRVRVQVLEVAQNFYFWSFCIWKIASTLLSVHTKKTILMTNTFAPTIATTQSKNIFLKQLEI